MTDDSPSSLRLGRAVLPGSWQVLSCQGVFLRLKAVKMNRYVESVEKDCMMTFMEKYLGWNTYKMLSETQLLLSIFYSSGERYPMLFRGSQGLNKSLEMDMVMIQWREDSDDAWQVAKKDVPSSLLPEVYRASMCFVLYGSIWFFSDICKSWEEKTWENMQGIYRAMIFTERRQDPVVLQVIHDLFGFFLMNCKLGE